MVLSPDPQNRNPGVTFGQAPAPRGECRRGAEQRPLLQRARLLSYLREGPTGTRTAQVALAASWCSPLTPGEAVALPDTWKAPVFHVRSEAGTAHSEGGGVTAVLSRKLCIPVR